MLRFEDMPLEDLDEEAIARMLEEADKEEVSEVDATGVKQLLLVLERKINRNQMMRVKFPEQPERFVDSEVSCGGHLRAVWAVLLVVLRRQFGTRLVHGLLYLRKGDPQNGSGGASARGRRVVR